ncbi:transketolase [Klebsiella pneumoniae subsp. rhinoscleromatis]|nr:transketolase [Klebsiella pneumoniae subsp. rhinoscleromatis]
MNPYRYDIQTLERKARAVRRHIVRLNANSPACGSPRYKVAAYVIASLLAGLGGILLASRIGSSQVNAGGGYLMDAVAAALDRLFAGGLRQTQTPWGRWWGGDPRRALQRAGDALGAVLRDGHY